MVTDHAFSLGVVFFVLHLGRPQLRKCAQCAYTRITFQERVTGRRTANREYTGFDSRDKELSGTLFRTLLGSSIVPFESWNNGVLAG